MPILQGSDGAIPRLAAAPVWKYPNLVEATATPRGEETMITKKEILEAIQRLPEHATVEDAMERLYLLHKIEQGVVQSDSVHG